MEKVDFKKLALGIVVSILLILVAGFAASISKLFILIYLPPILAGYNTGWDLKKLGSTDMKQATIQGFIVSFIGIIVVYILYSSLIYSSSIGPLVHIFYSWFFRYEMLSKIVIYSILGIVGGIIGMKK